ncbi:hypothetical protein GGF43_004217 [Coemansia sp. RSA 2618]|nr:hypothetical protein GGF43_004217 [Coemansia sp. RSA 2618]
MSEFSDNSTAGGNAFRPYAEPVGQGSRQSADLNPLSGVRNMSSTRLNPLPMDVSSLADMEMDLELDTELDTAQAAVELGKFAGYRFLAVLGSNPFTVAQTLLQVQHLPTAVRAEAARPAPEDEGETPDPDDPAYYEYLRARHSGRSTRVGKAATDHSGYVVRGPRPGYELAALPSGKLGVMRRLVQHPTEGVLSLFKGTFTGWAYDMLHLLLQPTLEGALNEALGVYDSVLDAAPSALTLIVSSVAVGWLLSPLELVRTRLVVQSASPIHRKYRGAMHALRTVMREEGGLRALYFDPFFAVPTLVKHSLEAAFRGLGAAAVDRVAGVDRYDHPVLYSAAGLAWRTLSALVMAPIDTVRTRLQAQPRYTSRAKSAEFHEFRTCVPTAAVPYTGMANCMWRVAAEEGQSLKQMRRAMQMQPAASNVGHYGLRGLYPGLSIHLVANVLIFGLGIVGGDEEITF